MTTNRSILKTGRKSRNRTNKTVRFGSPTYINKQEPISLKTQLFIQTLRNNPNILQTEQAKTLPKDIITGLEDTVID